MFRHPRILAAAVLLILVVFALPVLAPQTPTTEQTFETPSAGQESSLQLGVGERACSLTLSEDEAVLTLGSGCLDVAERLRIPVSGTLWLSLTLSDQPDTWLALGAVTGDTDPPEFDQRGRFFGCTQAPEGEQVCQVMVEINEKVYRVDIPLMSEVE